MTSSRSTTEEASAAPRPGKTGLYDPRYEHDACGVGFVAHIKGRRSHQILVDAEEMLRHMDHRGAFHQRNGEALHRTGRHPYAYGTCHCAIAEAIRHLRDKVL